jgi:tetratricopeptide (TPR) repeat protein
MSKGMASGSRKTNNEAEIDRLALIFAKEPGSKVFIPLAEEYGKAGMWNEAAGVLEDGLKTYPGFIIAMVALGRAYEQMNQPVKAKAILEEAIKLSPDNLRAHRTLAKLYAAQGTRDAAIRSCNVILALNPHDQEALSLRTGLEALGDHGSQDDGMRVEEKRTSTRIHGDGHGEQMGSTVESAVLAQANETNSRSLNQPPSGAPPRSAATQESRSVSRSSAVMQLEQWLSSIQLRRRDSQSSSELNSKTSS